MSEEIELEEELEQIDYDLWLDAQCEREYKNERDWQVWADQSFRSER